ncbi:ABC transporter substrate-binding protein [Novosphingobium flavum]|uniref:ABC transporter substrate-binding protein n=1 Tax=Novosphingobium flavum TaxID=1778672 RepID=A0A7X1KL87_9SPHN|nr:ABC transporter substrate-binding protein [Novosphingobium flavum]MBC2665307.1 ABC transporter substrate-binding protein [Novosphingobium flavum]
MSAREPSRRMRAARLLAAACALTLVAGCGTKEDMTGKPNAEGLIPIRVAGFEGINSATPLFVAKKQGFFKEAGLDVTYISLSSGAAAVAAAIKVKEIDVGLGAASQWISDAARGAIQGKIIGEFTDNNYVILGGNGITDVRQLEGKIFAISAHNGGDHMYSQAVLKRFGVPADKVTWLPMGEPASRLSALTAGKVDATELPLTNLPAAARDKVILTPDNTPVPFVSNAIFARQGLIDANRDAVKKFVAAIGRASDWIRAHPAEAVPACRESGSSEAGCKTAIEVALAAKNGYTWSSTSKVNTAAIETMLPIVGTVVPQAAKMKVSDIVDASIAGQ